MNRIRDGYVYVRNPFNSNQISSIPLRRDIVDFIVFWSKNPEPLMKYMPEINSAYSGAFYFQFTINPYERDIEPGLPELNRRIETLHKIAEIYGQEKVVWRYDPIMLTEKYTLDWHRESFYKLCQETKFSTDTCVISFIDMYDRTVKNTKQFGISSLSSNEMEEIASSFSAIARECGITIKTCAEGIDLKKYGIEPNSCIDQNRIEKIIDCRIHARPDHQRENCHCIECADIGQYNTCMHGCRYCYANCNEALVRQTVASHDDESPLLSGTISDTCVIKDYSKAKSFREPSQPEQLTLFSCI